MRGRRTSEALALLDKAIAFNPSYDQAWTARARIEYHEKRYSRALEDVEKALTLKPSAPLYDLRGLCKAYLGRFADAVADFNKAIETAAGRAPGPVFSNRGWAYLELGQPRKAISDLDRGIELSPDYTKAYENRAMAHSALKEWDLAIQDYTAAIQLQPTAWQYRKRAEAKRNAGDEKGAQEDDDRAALLPPASGDR